VAELDIAAGTTAWYFTDHLGTPVLQTDAAASTVWRPEYEPYGSVHTFRAGSTLHQPLRFPGQENDGSSDRSYNIFRWYRAGFARYTQADPILPFMNTYMAAESAIHPSLGSMLGYFREYNYVGSRPLTFDDPLGLGKVPGIGDNWSVDESCSQQQCLPYKTLDENWDEKPLPPKLDPVLKGKTASIDAIYWKNTIMKIPGNCNAKLICKPSGNVIQTICVPIPGKKPITYKKGQKPDPPGEWPPYF
jgi:RHS repeat-associated protein